ncbi:transmembrane adaptor Erv26 [Acrasis kona]|uniref:Transmembrane adaptor Erv26 n=1 Tax=Acrasis kona TaxID=1008807 RepID=A0AAW2YH55_9EUKA
MFLFVIIAYASLYVGLAFCALCLATGLYYLAELAEEYAVIAKKINTWLILSIIVIHILLWIFDEFKLNQILFGIVSHIVYFQLLKGFPYIRVKSISFIASCACFLISHVLWYYHFTDYRTPYYDLSQLLGFFFSCVWLAPTALFVTLSIGDMSLPGVGGLPASANNDILTPKSREHHHKQNVFTWIMDTIKNLTGKKQTEQQHYNNNLPPNFINQNIFTGNEFRSPPSPYKTL